MMEQMLVPGLTGRQAVPNVETYTTVVDDSGDFTTNGYSHVKLYIVHDCIFICWFEYIQASSPFTLWLFNIAMENGPWN